MPYGSMGLQVDADFVILLVDCSVKFSVGVLFGSVLSQAYHFLKNPSKRVVLIFFNCFFC